MADYYSTKKILDIIKYYHINLNNLKTLAAENQLRSVGVAQYGIEASLPKGNNISSVVENEVLRQVENTKFFAGIITDMKYLQDRWHRVTTEREAMVLKLRLDGHKAKDIAQMLGVARSEVYRTLERIACQIKGYPQENETNETNFGN